MDGQPSNEVIRDVVEGRPDGRVRWPPLASDGALLWVQIRPQQMLAGRDVLVERAMTSVF